MTGVQTCALPICTNPSDALHSLACSCPSPSSSQLGESHQGRLVLEEQPLGVLQLGAGERWQASVEGTGLGSNGLGVSVGNAEVLGHAYPSGLRLNHSPAAIMDLALGVALRVRKRHMGRDLAEGDWVGQLGADTLGVNWERLCLLLLLQGLPQPCQIGRASCRERVSSPV